MYSIDCSYYKKEFNHLEQLAEDVMRSGMDPNYEILRNGKPTGEMLIDHIVF